MQITKEDYNLTVTFLFPDCFLFINLSKNNN